MGAAGDNPQGLEEILRAKEAQIAEAEGKLMECRDLLVRQEKLATIGQMAAGIVHEINNPLGFLRSNHSTLGNYLLSIEAFLREVARVQEPSIVQAAAAHRIDHILSDLSQLLKDCDDGIQRITEIVQSLKTFSRLDPEAAYVPFDLASGISSALIVAHNEVKYVADVTLSLAELPPVECAPGEIMQVLLNIIVNAAQAITSQGRPEKGRIEIRSGLSDGFAWIEVQDDGPGIPQEIQPRIFESFFTTKPRGQGTGLGLSISYDIITRKHGGRLSVKSEQGAGACFRIELPLKHGRDLTE